MSVVKSVREWGKQAVELTYEVQPDDNGQRAVDVLTRRTGMSRLMSKKIRLYGELLCNGKHHRMIDPVCTGDRIVARYDAGAANPDMQPQTKRFQSAELRQVPGVAFRYLDEWILAAAKPAGMVTHPTYLHETGSLTDLLADTPLHPVSRLDRDTTGIVLIARNGHAHHVISRHIMKKTYLALLHGRFPAASGLINAPIQRAPGSMMLREISRNGASARTIWQELRYFAASDISLVRFELLTGRTHQLRLHSQACGCPIVGETLYGRVTVPDRQERARFLDQWDRLAGHQALHAASLRFYHPISLKAMQVTAPLPASFQHLLAVLRVQEKSSG